MLRSEPRGSDAFLTGAVFNPVFAILNSCNSHKHWSPDLDCVSWVSYVASKAKVFDSGASKIRPVYSDIELYDINPPLDAKRNLLWVTLTGQNKVQLSWYLNRTLCRIPRSSSGALMHDVALLGSASESAGKDRDKV